MHFVKTWTCICSAFLASMLALPTVAIKSSTSSDSQALDTASSNIVPYNLEGIEQSLMSLYRSGHVTPQLGPYITQIRELTNQMKKQVLFQVNVTQSNLNMSWNNFIKCSVSDSPKGSSNMSDMDREHRECSQKESDLYEKLEQCLEVLVVLENTTNVSYTHYTVWEKNWPTVCTEPEPIADSEKVKPRLEEWVNYFRNASKMWNATYSRWQTAKKKYEGKYEKCEAAMKQYNETFENCTKMQQNMENVACGDGDSSCQAYTCCWERTYPAWTAQTLTAKSEEQSFQTEWKAILRIACLLNAFDEDVAGTTPLTNGIALCRSKNFTTQHYMKDVSLVYFPKEEAPLPAFVYCNETAVDPGHMPGTQGWHDKYCAGLPTGTSCEACAASCCASSGAVAGLGTKAKPGLPTKTGPHMKTPHQISADGRITLNPNGR
eukprot:TRINITY_DN111317_c0_g1_i1.p1 TRINITY_DN111317_c0_g1~~TRINITY_DN111317_c0_g1_i1.p1  ORF type:complete len:434 (+),score=69.68 TRINITY_DN111317_c0_g1_i1:175-1476(+)